MKRERLDIYDIKPEGMEKYLSEYGWHFSKAMCDWAVKLMRDRSGDKLAPYGKEKTDQLLQTYGIEVPTDIGYDAVYVTNMARADFYGSSISDEQHLAKYVGDYINDPDAYDGMPFTRFYADMIGAGKPIMWVDML